MKCYLAWVQAITGWPRHRENREFDSYFFQTGKTQGILLWHRENCWDRENILTVFCYVNVIFWCTFGSPGFKLWGFVGDSWVLLLIRCVLMASVWGLENGASSPSILKAKWTLGLWPVGGGERVTSFSHLGAPPLHWGGPPLVAKGCPGCGPVSWGSFLSGYMVPLWVPLSLPPLKNNYLCGSPCQFFFKLGFQEMLKVIVWKMF